MKASSRYAEWASLTLWVGLVGVVFWQTNTDFVEQGVAGGDAFNNAAYFPEIVASIIIGCTVLVGGGFVIRKNKVPNNPAALSAKELRKPVALLAGFAAYVFLMDVIGYHLATAPFLFFVIWLCSERKVLGPVIFSETASVLVSIAFERYLNVVLPSGNVADLLGW